MLCRKRSRNDVVSSAFLSRPQSSLKIYTRLRFGRGRLARELNEWDRERKDVVSPLFRSQLPLPSPVRISCALSSLVGSLSSDVFERRTSTGNGNFALLSRDFEQLFGQIVSLRIKTLGNINTVASRLINRGKGSLPLDVRRSKTSLLKLPSI